MTSASDGEAASGAAEAAIGRLVLVAAAVADDADVVGRSCSAAVFPGCADGGAGVVGGGAGGWQPTVVIPNVRAATAAANRVVPMDRLKRNS